jgi:hypothetical protein
VKTAALALFVLLCSCSKNSATPSEPAATATATPAGTTTAADNAESRAPPGQRPFGARCKADSDCATGGVCFLRKPKEGKDGQERVHGYCSMACASDADCASPPTSGKCGKKKKMCRRTKGQAAQNGDGPPPGAGPSPTPPGSGQAATPPGSGQPQVGSAANQPEEDEDENTP